MLGNKLKILRKNNNITQAELAEALKVSTGAVGLWELNKRNPDTEILLKIAKFFNVTVDYLLCDEEDNVITIIGRNGSFQKYKLNEDNLKAIVVLAETLDKNNR